MDTLEEVKQILKENALAMVEIRKIQQENSLAMVELRKHQQEHSSAMVELRKFQQETSVQMKKTDAKLKEVCRQLGDIGHSSGDAAEEFFYNALEQNKFLGNQKFDEISKNIKAKKHRLEDEYDIFMENGSAVAIVEVKHKVRKEHITKLLETKAENFRILFPDYAAYKLFVGIAGLAFDHKTEEYAIENGIAILKQKGDVVHINANQMRAF